VGNGALISRPSSSRLFHAAIRASAFQLLAC